MRIIYLQQFLEFATSDDRKLVTEIGEVATQDAPNTPCLRHSFYGIPRHLWFLTIEEGKISQISASAIIPSPADFCPYEGRKE